MLPYRDSRFIRIILVLFFVLVIGYGIYEAQGFLYGPVIHVPEDTITVREPFTSVSGRADRISELRLNGHTISVTESGEFSEPYLLAEGTNRLVLEARDVRGRKVTKTLDILYIPSEESRRQPVRFPAASSTATTTSPESLE